MFYLFNGDNPHALSLAEKMCKEAKPGALINTTDDELRAFENGEFIAVDTETHNGKLIEFDTNKEYILFADQTVNLDDIDYHNQHSEASIRVIRVDK